MEKTTEEIKNDLAFLYRHRHYEEIEKYVLKLTSSQPVVKQLSDEEIEKFTLDLPDNSCKEGNHNMDCWCTAFEDGMKAYRDLLCSKENIK